MFLDVGSQFLLLTEGVFNWSYFRMNWNVEICDKSLSRKIKLSLKNVTRRFDVSNIITKSEKC